MHTLVLKHLPLLPTLSFHYRTNGARDIDNVQHVPSSGGTKVLSRSNVPSQTPLEDGQLARMLTCLR